MCAKSPIKTDRTRGRTIALVIFALALGLRLIYLIQIRSSPFFDAPIADAGWHDTWAMQIVSGGWGSQGVFFRAPLYPYFLALIYTLLGHGYFMIRLVQIFLGSASCALVFLLGQSLFNRKVGLVAGIVASLYGVLIYFDAELLIPVVIIFLDLLMLWLLVGRKRSPSAGAWALAGLAMGLSAIARPNILLFMPFLFLWLWIIERRKGRRRGWKGLILFCSMTILMILPVAANNLRAGDGRVLISSQAGINFYIGNAGGADGKISAPPGGVTYQDRHRDNVWAASERLAQQTLGRSLKPSQVSSFWFEKALDEIRERPLSWLGLMARKLYFFWNGHEIESNQSIYTSRQWSSLLRILVWKWFLSFPFGLLAPLALVGFWLTRRAWRGHLLIYFFVIAYLLSVLAFFVNFRFRAPVLPVLIIYASHAGVWIVGMIRTRKWAVLAPTVGLLIILLLVVNSALFGAAQTNVAREHYLQGMVYEQKGMVSQAAEQYRRCLELDPYTVQAHYNLAKIYRQAGYSDAAIAEFRNAVAVMPDFAEGYNGLGITYAQRGEHQQAIEAFQRSLQLDPRNGWAYLNLANVFQEIGQPDSALARYRQALRLLPGEAYIRQQIMALEGTGGP